jgi:hypothetical protein
MKPSFAVSLGIKIAMLILLGCATRLIADMESYVNFYVQVYGEYFSGNGWTVNASEVTNLLTSQFGYSATFRYEEYLNTNGSYAYLDLERYIVGDNVYHKMRVSGATMNNGFAYNGAPEANSSAESVGSIYEDLMIQYLPSSITDTPPTSVSFQVSYLGI